MVKKPKIKEIELILDGKDFDYCINHIESIEKEFEISFQKLKDKYIKKKDLQDKEIARLKEMYIYESISKNQGYKVIAGVDEVGRGPLAGPVVTAAVILPDNCFIEKLNDSKKLSAKQRDELFEIITEKAVAYEFGIVDEKCIDDINILNATKKAMGIAINNLNPKPDMLLIDAVKLEDIDIKQTPIIKGDSLSASIAAASIIAKVTRDRLMDEFDKEYPQYGFIKHKGYGTKDHIEAIKKFGICPIHRVSFTKNFV